MKLDLHTHCWEAVRVATGGVPISDDEAADLILRAVRTKGLDGIALTDHDRRDFAHRIRTNLLHRGVTDILVIEGREEKGRLGQGVDERWRLQHIVELYLPGDATFRFVAHPSSLDWNPAEMGVNGVEMDNGGGMSVPREEVAAFASRHNLLTLSNSDAHCLEDIGTYHTEIELKDLVRRVQVRSTRNGAT